MGKRKSRPIIRVPRVDLTKPRYDFLAQFFNRPLVYGTPSVPFGTLPMMNPRPQMPSPSSLPSLSIPPNLPPRKSVNDVNNRNEMIKLFVMSGYCSIPVDDPPMLFNEILASKVGIIGANQIGHVICRGQPDYETFFCFMCEHWGTPSEMITHLENSEHQLKYMQKFFKEKHRKIIIARSRDREALQRKMIMEISKAESDKKVVKRLNTVLTVNILFKCWPSFLSHFNNLWKIEDDDVKEVKTIITLDPPIPRSVSMPAILERQSTSQQVEDDDEEETKPNISDMNLCVYALVFIRAQAITKKGITLDEIHKICGVIGVKSEMAFSDAVLEYAGRKIGSVEILVAIGKYYANPIQKLSELLKKFVKTAPPLEPPKLLLELGVDTAKAAKMVRDVAMLNFITKESDVSKGFSRRVRKFYDDTYIDDMGRQQILYDGDYIEDGNNCDKYTPFPKRRKEE